MSSELVVKTARWSTFAQILFGLASFVGFLAPKQNDFLIVLLIADLVVQLIELLFYVFFVYYRQLPTSFRYIDWYVTTPVQLVSNVALLEYFSDKTVTIVPFLENNGNEIILIVVLNFVMLSLGLLAEFYERFKFYLVTIGVAPFVGNFYLIYQKYAVKTTEGIIINTYVCIIWLLYAVAAYMNYNIKNIMYNILDIFSKNFYGLFVGIYLFYA
jgi:bacteriorhodopsin